MNSKLKSFEKSLDQFLGLDKLASPSAMHRDLTTGDQASSGLTTRLLSAGTSQGLSGTSSSLRVPSPVVNGKRSDVAGVRPPPVMGADPEFSSVDQMHDIIGTGQKMASVPEMLKGLLKMAAQDAARVLGVPARGAYGPCGSQVDDFWMKGFSEELNKLALLPAEKEKKEEEEEEDKEGIPDTGIASIDGILETVRGNKKKARKVSDMMLAPIGETNKQAQMPSVMPTVPTTAAVADAVSDSLLGRARNAITSPFVGARAGEVPERKGSAPWRTQGEVKPRVSEQDELNQQYGVSTENPNNPYSFSYFARRGDVGQQQTIDESFGRTYKFKDPSEISGSREFKDDKGRVLPSGVYDSNTASKAGPKLIDLESTLTNDAETGAGGYTFGKGTDHEVIMRGRYNPEDHNEIIRYLERPKKQAPQP